MERTFLCNLEKSCTNYFPCNQGVFIEEGLKVYLCGEINMPKKVFYCIVPNWTWQANSTGVYYKDTRLNKIFHVSGPGKKPRIICETDENSWMPHNRGGVFILEDKTGFLSFSGKSEPIKNREGNKKSFLKLLDISFSEETMFRDKEFLSFNVPRLFFPFENGYFFRALGSIYYHSIDNSENIHICNEPKNGKWNAYNGQVLLAKESGVFLHLNSKLSQLFQTEYTSMKGAPNGIVICENHKSLYYHAKPKWLEDTNSLTI